MLDFRGWMEGRSSGAVSEGSNPGAKTGLYPMGYGGVGLYPPQWYPTRSADAIFYFSVDERIYKGKEGGPFDITHIPGRVNSSMNSGEGGLWDITGVDRKAPRKDETAGSYAIVGCGDSPNFQVWGARSDLGCAKRKSRILDMKFGDWAKRRGRKKSG